MCPLNLYTCASMFHFQHVSVIQHVIHYTMRENREFEEEKKETYTKKEKDFYNCYKVFAKRQINS